VKGSLAVGAHERNNRNSIVAALVPVLSNATAAIVNNSFAMPEVSI
jgi:hypothetical protein